MSSGITDSSLVYHLENAKAHGVTRAEAAAIITHAAFYAGWPKGWAVFRLAKEVWKDEDGEKEEQHGGMFGLGQPNDAYARYFVGQSYLNPVAGQSGVNIANVTFEPGCRNNWHIHKAQKGGGQLLLCTEGRGWYQEWGKEARELHPAMRWRSLRASNTGMALQRTAGSPIWRWSCPVKTPSMNGWKR